MKLKENIDNLKYFLPNLIAKWEDVHLKQISSDKLLLSNIFEKLSKIETKQQEFVKTHAPHFNLFDVLRYGHYETRLHTPFLVSLLTPYDSHQLRFKFLELFLSDLFENKINIDKIENYQIIEELSVGDFGQIDIFMTFKYENQKYCIAVENKINARDQEEQLERYYNFMYKNYGNSHILKLVYLTKCGKLPSTTSLKNDLLNQYFNENILFLKSYKKNIFNMISQLEQDNKIPEVVRFTLQQYKLTIQNFPNE